MKIDKATPKKKTDPVKAKANSGERFSQPCYSIEWTRNQIMCRTGLRGAGQSHRIIFGTRDVPTFAVAQKIADKWVQDTHAL